MEIFKGRFLGHPIHPMLVHFPTALFSVAVLFDTVGLLFNDASFIHASVYCMGVGLGIGLIAAFFGFVDYLKLVESEQKVFQKASWHGAIQFLVLTSFGIVFGFRVQSYPAVNIPAIWELAFCGFLVLIMLAGNYLGGDLVFNHSVGIAKKHKK